MQYFKPAEANLFVGDCMPFYHEDVFHLYYLLDEGHHRALGGLGGHQWAHMSSTDLINWDHHPLAIAITEDQEGSICTGATFFHAGRYYGFYATRYPDWTQHLSLAVSDDAVHFDKIASNPLFTPPTGYKSEHFRDPFVFADPETGHFHMIVTAWLEDYPINRYGGCLAHLTSSDLLNWTLTEPFLIPGLPDAPECADYFFWNGWYYLLFSNELVTRYRMSREPFGHWQRPPVDVLDGRLARVMKTAPFRGNRRIGVSWIGKREGDKDNGNMLWGGHTIFRELVQHPDGTLGIKFLPEMMDISGALLQPYVTALTDGASGNYRHISVNAPHGFAAASLSALPQNICLSAVVEPQPGTGEFGLRLRADEQFENSYALIFSPHEKRVQLHNETIYAVDGLDEAFTLQIILSNDIIDVCINNRRCIVNRCPELTGDTLYLYCQNGAVTLNPLKITTNAL